MPADEGVTSSVWSHNLTRLARIALFACSRRNVTTGRQPTNVQNYGCADSIVGMQRGRTGLRRSFGSSQKPAGLTRIEHGRLTPTPRTRLLPDETQLENFLSIQSPHDGLIAATSNSSLALAGNTNSIWRRSHAFSVALTTCRGSKPLIFAPPPGPFAATGTSASS